MLMEDTEYVGASGQKLTSIDEDRQFVPYYGIVYDLTETTSLYASHAEIYKSQATLLQGPPPGAKALEPLTGADRARLGHRDLSGEKLARLLA